MGLLLLVFAYAALAALLALAARRGGARPSLAAALFLTLLPLAFTAGGFWPGRTLAPTPMLAGVPPWADPGLEAAIRAGSSPPNPLMLDPTSQFIPWREAARHDLLYDPAQGSGAALLANGQSAALFPTEVVARFLPAFRAVTFSQAARLLLAAWGLFLLARALAASELAALAAATVWTGCGFLQLWRLHPHSLVAAVAPWVLLALVALVRRPGPRPAVALAVAGAVGVAGGHPETLLHVVLLGLGLVVAALALGERAGVAERRPGRVVVWGGAGAALSLLLAAPALLPFVENLAVSREWVSRSAGGTVVELPLEQSLVRLKPTFALRALGNPGAGTWTGPENLAELGGGAVGTAGLVLAFLALVRGRRRRLVAALLLLGLLGLAVSVHLAGVSRPFGALPLLRESLLKRLSLWWALAVSLAAGFGVDAWRWERGFGDGRWWSGAWWHRGAAAAGPGARGWTPAVLAVVGAVAVLVTWAAGAPWSVHRAVLVPEWGALAVVAAILLLPLRGSAAGALVVLVLLLPRVPLFARWIPQTVAESFYLRTPAVAHVEREIAALGGGGRVAGLYGALVPHSASFFGLEEVRAYDPMTFAPYAELMTAMAPSPPFGWTPVPAPSHPVLAFLGVRFVFDHPAAPRHAGVPVAYEGSDARVYAPAGALPRVYVPDRVEVHPDPRTAVEAAREIADFGRRVTASGPGGPHPALGPPGITFANPRARVEELEVAGRRVTARVTSPAPVVIATSQPAIPGWRLTVDGEAAAPLRVNGAFLGAALAPGSHRVELVYAPRSWTMGLALAALGTVLAGWLALPRPRRRTPERA